MKEFRWFKGKVPLGFFPTSIGVITRCEFSITPGSDPDFEFDIREPPLDNEYFEWIDILETVAARSGSFAFCELGAGYGRWSAAAALACRQRNRPFHAIMVEAEPKHAEWAELHAKDNDFEASVIKAAVGAERGAMEFVVQQATEDVGASDPNIWYGQALARDAGLNFAQATTGAKNYFGHKMKVANGWGAIEVPVITLADALGDRDVIDLIDADIQGGEADVFCSAMDLVNRRVRAIHIGTHSHTVEDRLRAAFNAHGWRTKWDFPCQTKRVSTPYGPVDFGDGVQGWVNPRFGL